MSSPLPINDADISTRDVSAPSRLRNRLLAIVFIVLIAGVLIRILMPKPAPAPVVKHYTPREAQAAERNIAAIQKQILGQPAAAPASSSSSIAARDGEMPSFAVSASTKARNVVRLQFSEADLNAYAATDPQIKAILTRKGVSAVQILLSGPSNIVLRAAINYKGRAANLQVVGKLVPSVKTTMRLQVASAKIGSIPIPSSTVAAEVDNLVSKAANPMRNRLPLAVNEIRVANHNLILTGTRHPPKSSERR